MGGRPRPCCSFLSLLLAAGEWVGGPGRVALASLLAVGGCVGGPAHVAVSSRCLVGPPVLQLPLVASCVGWVGGGWARPCCRFLSLLGGVGGWDGPAHVAASSRCFLRWVGGWARCLVRLVNGWMGPAMLLSRRFLRWVRGWVGPPMLQCPLVSWWARPCCSFLSLLLAADLIRRSIAPRDVDRGACSQ